MRISIFYLSLIFILCGCKTKPITFNFKTPTNWVRIDALSKNGDLQVKIRPDTLSSTPIFIKNISISIIRTSKSIDAYWQSIYNMMQNKFMIFREIDTGNYSSERYSYKWFLCQTKNKNDEDFIKQKVYFLLSKKKYLVMITCSAKTSEMEIFQQEIDIVLDSLNLSSKLDGE